MVFLESFTGGKMYFKIFVLILAAQFLPTMQFAYALNCIFFEQSPMTSDAKAQCHNERIKKETADPTPGKSKKDKYCKKAADFYKNWASNNGVKLNTVPTEPGELTSLAIEDAIKHGVIEEHKAFLKLCAPTSN